VEQNSSLLAQYSIEQRHALQSGAKRRKVVKGRIFRFVVCAAACTAVVPLHAQVKTDRLSSGTSGGFLQQDQKLTSANGKFVAVMQSDGHLCIYENGRFVWGNGAYGKGTAPYKLAMQADSNLVQYGASGETWSSGARSSGKAPYTLIMQDDGNLAIYDNANSHVWSRMVPNQNPVIVPGIQGNDKATADSLWNNYYVPADNPPDPAWVSSGCQPGTTSAA
jgi:hypothetical protein